jgi:ATP-dependent Clp protease ATP-binding subunit ClpA
MQGNKVLRKYIHSIIEEAGRAAQEDGSATIEAEHLLLAIASDQEPTTRQILTSAGLDRRTVREALDREFEHSLDAAGVFPGAFDLQRTSGAQALPRLGASAKLAVERGVGSAGRKSDLQPAHLLLGILQARVGTVPRALELAGIDQSELRTRVQETVEGGTKR